MADKDAVNYGDRNVEKRQSSLEEVRKKLRSGWRNDPAVLQQYFQSAYNNWKVYQGPRTPKQVLKLQAIYKQATYGDNHEQPPERIDSIDGEKWKAWASLRGMTQEMAKRRFITFLSEIDPLLIDVMPDEKPPPGFPLDRRGNPICAKCNTTVGCIRPILDQHKMNLKMQLFDNEELHEPNNLKAWIRNALVNQRCIWGIHMPIARAEAKPFMDWFNRDENRGFYPYDSVPIMAMVKEVVNNYHQMAQEMMENKDKMNPEEYNVLAIKAYKLRDVYEQFSGEDYRYEVFCTRDNESCNQRRMADGGKNHKHEFTIDPPTKSDANTMEEAIMLRQQCQRLGINPSTGVVKSLEERCQIYRARIADHFEALRKAAEAKIRNEHRADVHRSEKNTVIALSKEMLQRQMWDACQANLVDHVMTLAKRGGDLNEESPRGITPLICMVLNEAVVEKIETLINTYGADANQPNKYGFTPLMMACRLKDLKMVHVLMRSGASALQTGFNGQTALHVCALHGSEEMARIIVDYLKDGAGDSMRVLRFLDAVDDDGDSALILAARQRHGIMCHTLCALGVNVNLRNSTGRTAAYVARSHTWTEIADWLEKKVGTSINRIETFSDLEFERKCRFGLIKTRELLQQFGKRYLMLVLNRLGLHPLGTPFKARSFIEERGEKARQEQRRFMDNHFRYILQRCPEQFPSLLAVLPNSYHVEVADSPHTETAVQEQVDGLHGLLTEILGLVRLGYTCPDVEVGAQPLPWTPMMCAVALNDVRTVKVLVREGADLNHGNRDGTTPIMLAAQLQHVEMIVELLALGASLQAVDNQGYSPLAYATSLPLPTLLDRSYVAVMTNDDVGGAKYLSASEIIKAALAELPPLPTAKDDNRNDHAHTKGTVGGKQKGVKTPYQVAMQAATDHLRSLIAKNQIEAGPANVEVQSKLLQLLHQYGLTPIRDEYNLEHQLTTSKWRVADGDEEDVNGKDTGKQAKRKRKKQGDDEDNDDSGLIVAESAFEEEAKKSFEEIEEEKRRQKEAALKALGDPNQLRCPMCTLSLPCPHFFKIESLMTFLKNNSAVTVSSSSNGAGGSGAVTIRFARKVKSKNRAQEVMEETQLYDRNTDRSATLAKQFQVRETALEKAWQERLAQEAETTAQLEEEAAYNEYFAGRKDHEGDVSSTEHMREELYEVQKEESAGKVRRDATETVVQGPGSQKGENSRGSSSSALVVRFDNVAEGGFTPDMSLSIVPVSILKPPSRQAQYGDTNSAFTSTSNSVWNSTSNSRASTADAMALTVNEHDRNRLNSSQQRKRVHFVLDLEEDREDPDDENEEGGFDGLSGRSSDHSVDDVDDDGSASSSASSSSSNDSSGENEESHRDSESSRVGVRKANLYDKKPSSRSNQQQKKLQRQSLRRSDDKAVKASAASSVEDEDDNTDAKASATVSNDALVAYNHSDTNAVGQQTSIIDGKQDTDEEFNDQGTEEDAMEHEAWEANQEIQRQKGLHHALDVAYDALTSGVISKDYIQARLQQESIDVKHQESVPVLPFVKHHDQHFGQRDGIFAPMEDRPLQNHHKPSQHGTTAGHSANHHDADAVPDEEDTAVVDFKVVLSGYLFVHLCDMRAPTLPPVSLSVSQNAWTSILVHLQQTFQSEWTQSMDLSPLIHHTNWQVTAPTCVLCQIGYVRDKETLSLYRTAPDRYEARRLELLQQLYHNASSSSESSATETEQRPSVNTSSMASTASAAGQVPSASIPNPPRLRHQSSADIVLEDNQLIPFLCLSCLVRRRLYYSVLHAQPRALRRTLQTRWPLLTRDNHHYNHAFQDATVDEQMNAHPLSPMPRHFPPLIAMQNPEHHASTAEAPDPQGSPADGVEETKGGHASAVSASVSSPPRPLPSYPASPLRSETLRTVDDVLAGVTFERYSARISNDVNDVVNVKTVTGEGLKDENVDEDEDAWSQVSALSQVSEHLRAPLLRSASRLQQTATQNNQATSTDTVSQTDLHTFTSLTLSTVSQVNPTKRPRELLLLPCLVAEGLDDDVERTARILLGKKAVDEGEGLAYLLETLGALCDSYHLAGLYLLALTIYLDLLTRTVALCGWFDRLSLDTGLTQVLLCYRRMNLVAQADTLVREIQQSLQSSLRSVVKKQDALQRVQRCYRDSVAKFLDLHSLWTHHLQPRLYHTPQPQQPHSALVRKRWSHFESVLGLAGFYAFYTSTQPLFVVQRKVFKRYVHAIARHDRDVARQRQLWQRRRDEALNAHGDGSQRVSGMSAAEVVSAADEVLRRLDQNARKLGSRWNAETRKHLSLYIDCLDALCGHLHQCMQRSVSHHLLQALWRHFLAKPLKPKASRDAFHTINLSSTSKNTNLSDTTRMSMDASPLPRIFRALTPRSGIHDLVHFFRDGRNLLSLQLFDGFVLHLLEELLPYFRAFFVHDAAGQVFRSHYLIDPTASHLPAEPRVRISRPKTASVAGENEENAKVEGADLPDSVVVAASHESVTEMSLQGNEMDEDEDVFRMPALAVALDAAVTMLQAHMRGCLTRRRIRLGVNKVT